MSRKMMVLATAAVAVLVCGNVWAEVQQGLMVHYTFEGDCADVSGNGNDGVCTGEDFGAGWEGLAFCLDGDDDDVEVPYTDVTQDITVALWINMDSLPVDDATHHTFTLFNIYEDNEGAFNFSYQAPNPSEGLDRHLQAGVWAGDNWVSFKQEITLPTDAWVHLAMTYSAADETLRIYLNGAPLAAMTDVAPPSGDHPKAGTEAYIASGYSYGGLPAIGHIDGCIDGFRVYARQLSDKEIEDLVNPESWGAGTPPQASTVYGQDNVVGSEMANNLGMFLIPLGAAFLLRSVRRKYKHLNAK